MTKKQEIVVCFHCGSKMNPLKAGIGKLDITRERGIPDRGIIFRTLIYCPNKPECIDQAKLKIKKSKI